MGVAYSAEAIARAKTEGLHLVKIEVNGRHAKKGSMSMAGPVGPKTAERLKALFADLCDAKKRME